MFLCSPEPAYAVPLPLVAGKLRERKKELGCFQLKSREEGKENKLIMNCVSCPSLLQKLQADLQTLLRSKSLCQKHRGAVARFTEARGTAPEFTPTFAELTQQLAHPMSYRHMLLQAI